MGKKVKETHLAMHQYKVDLGYEKEEDPKPIHE